MYTIKQIVKKFIIWCNYKYRKLSVKCPLLDKLVLRIYWGPRLYKKIVNLADKSKESIVNKYEEEVISNCKKFLEVKDKSNVFLYYNPGAAGDYATGFLFLRQIIYYLQEKKCNLFFIGHKKFKDVIKIFSKYFRLTYIFTEDSYCPISGIETIPKNFNYLKTIILDNNGLFFPLWDCWPNPLNVFLKTNGIIGGLYNDANMYEYHLNTILNKGKTISFNQDEKYFFNRVDSSKLDYLLENYSNNGEIFLCNFESKSLSLGNLDMISFGEYIKNLKFISCKYDIKFVVNSVYNNEKLYNDENILITRLNFQKIIRLAEHKKIKLFISERNGLNDVFKVFWPEINQIIYYSDCYWGYVDKKYFNKKYGNFICINDCDIMKFNLLPLSNNIQQLYRKDFKKTLENVILKYL